MIKKVLFFLIVFFAKLQVFAANFTQSDILPSSNWWPINSTVQVGNIDWLLSFSKDTIFGVLWILVVGVFIFIWTRLVIARWNPEEFKKALLQLVYAVVGLFVVSVAYLAVTLVSWLSI